MEGILHYLKLLRYCYHLDLEDYKFVTDAANCALNWGLPSFIAPWMFGNIYLLNKDVTVKTRRLVKLSKFLLPVISLEAAYLTYYYKNPELEKIFTKYPYHVDLSQRERLSHRQLRQKNK